MRFITLKDNKITAIRSGKTIVDGEIQSNLGKIGQLLQKNGTFIDDINDIEKQTKSMRIAELKELISNKKLLDMDCTTEQAELKELLGL